MMCALKLEVMIIYNTVNNKQENILIDSWLRFMVEVQYRVRLFHSKEPSVRPCVCVCALLISRFFSAFSFS
jgi:hypothetical protein